MPELTISLLGQPRVEAVRRDTLATLLWPEASRSNSGRYPQVQPSCSGLNHKRMDAKRYRGDFLSGFGLSDSTEFDDRQFFEGQELHQQFSALLPRIIETYSSTSQFEEALPYARRWVAFDQPYEPARRQLMRAYALAGQQTAAKRQYERCVQVLDDELGVPPAHKTDELFAQISDGKLEPQVVAQVASLSPKVTVTVAQHQVDCG